MASVATCSSPRFRYLTQTVWVVDCQVSLKKVRRQHETGCDEDE